MSPDGTHDGTHDPAREPLRVVAAVVRRGGRVLLTQRPPGKHLAGKWEFPGGKLEPGESAVDGLERECLEELGVDVRVGARLATLDHDYGDRCVRLIFHDCHIVRGEIRHLEVADHRWLPVEELHDVDLPPADAPLVPLLIALEATSPS